MARHPKILIIGLCALPMGTMERQLGNMAILIPMIRSIRETINNPEIVTSLQLSEEFCQRHGIVSLKYRSLFEPSLRSGLIAGIDFVRTTLWCWLKLAFKVNVGLLIHGRKLAEFRSADIIVDFSGDTFGDMGHPLHLLKHSLDLLTVIHLKKPVYIFAQSPGPFSTRFRRFIAKRVLGKVALITVREPIAAEALSSLGIRTPIVRTACPAFLLEPAKEEIAKAILLSEGVDTGDRPIAGMTITGFNFSKELISGDKYKTSRSEQELAPLVAVIENLVNDLDMDVLLIPHVYRTTASGDFMPGPDGCVAEQIHQIVSSRAAEADRERVHLLKGYYSASEVKVVIGQCSLYISGRLHAGVAALSQAIPTVLVAYSLKFNGFARLLGQEMYVSNALRGFLDAEDILTKIKNVWERREAVSAELASRMPAVRELARLNTVILADLLQLPGKKRLHIPRANVEEWQNISLQYYVE